MTMSRPYLAFSLLCGAVLVLAAKEASARTKSDGVATMASDFGLAEHRSDDSQRYRLEEPARRYPKDQLGPQWSYSPVSGGPTVEFGALGAGRKGAPRLAHVGVYSSF